MFINIYGEDQHNACGTLEETDLISFHYTGATVQSVQIVGLNGQLRQPRIVKVNGQRAEHDPGPIPARDGIGNGCIITTVGGSGISRPFSQLRYFFRGRVHQDMFLVLDLAEKGGADQPAPFQTTDVFNALWLGRKRLTVQTSTDFERLSTVLQWGEGAERWFDAGPWGKIRGPQAAPFFQQQFSMVNMVIETMHTVERNLRRSLDTDYDVSEGLQRAARAFWEHILLHRFLTGLGYSDPRH